MPIPQPYAHQQQTTDFGIKHPRVFDMSDPGTGKTRAHLDIFKAHREANGGPLLVLAPKSILYPAWGADIEAFTPHLTYSIAYATNRNRAFEIDADIYITNHDAAKWLSEQPKSFWRKFSDGRVIVDELTAYKHRTSQRSKAAKKVVSHFDYREGLTGTPNPNSITDLWHQALLLDDGERLGTSFWRYRSAVCTPTQVGPRADMVKWMDKPGAEDAVADLLSDITIRHKFEDCISIPPNVTHIVPFRLSPKALSAYTKLAKQSAIELESGTVTATHAGALYQKLLQLSSGAVYDGDGNAHAVCSERYELIMQLVDERPQSLVAFNWSHQRDALVAMAKKMGLSYGVIDGSVTDPAARNETVARFQNGELRVIFAHPKSASHGLTLTRGVATIWASPTFNAEWFPQFNQRIYRNGQTQPTETLLVLAEDTLDMNVYATLQGKMGRMVGLLDILQTDYQEAA